MTTDNATTDQGTKSICHECAERLRNARALYQLIYTIRGRHVCTECHRPFVVEEKGGAS